MHQKTNQKHSSDHSDVTLTISADATSQQKMVVQLLKIWITFARKLTLYAASAKPTVRAATRARLQPSDYSLRVSVRLKKPSAPLILRVKLWQCRVSAMWRTACVRICMKQGQN